jgi:hypothetical protein
MSGGLTLATLSNPQIKEFPLSINSFPAGIAAGSDGASILGLFLMNQVAALILPLAASKQLRRALTIRYRDSSVDSNIPGTSLDGVSSHFKILSAEIEIEPT